MDKKTHYKVFMHPNYFGVQDLLDDAGNYKEKVFFIESVGEELVQEKGKDSKAAKKVVRLRGVKPFIVNSENWHAIAQACGSEFTEDWIGKPIQIFALKGRYFGKDGMFPRVRPKSPELEKLTPNHKAWGKAKVALKEGRTTIAAIRKSYTLSPEDEKNILAE